MSNKKSVIKGLVTTNEITGVGLNSINNLTTGTNNVFVGYNTSNTLTTGNQNTLIGNGADTSNNNSSAQISIGYNAVPHSADSSAQIGEYANTGTGVFRYKSQIIAQEGWSDTFEYPAYIDATGNIIKQQSIFGQITYTDIFNANDFQVFPPNQMTTYNQSDMIVIDPSLVSQVFTLNPNSSAYITASSQYLEYSAVSPSSKKLFVNVQLSMQLLGGAPQNYCVALAQDDVVDFGSLQLQTFGVPDQILTSQSTYIFNTTTSSKFSIYVGNLSSNDKFRVLAVSLSCWEG